MNDVTQTLAAFAASVRYEDLPKEVRATTVDLIIDSIGCAVPGQLVEKGKIAVDIATADNATGPSSVIGTGRRTSIPMASFANGELINALDFDAILAPGHVTPYVIPPALAFAEAQHASGRDFVTAVALAHEIGCRVAASLDGLRELSGEPPHLEYELSPASGYGSTIFGAVAGAARLVGLDKASMASAFGLAGYAAPVPSLTQYLNAKHSFHAKYTSAGVVAMQGSMAVLMAQRGYLGDEAVLDGPHGFWRMFNSQRFNAEFAVAGLGDVWHMRRVELKPFPAFRMSHAAIDALRQVIAQEHIDPEAIVEMEVVADPVSMNACYVNTKIGNHTDAQLSWAHLLAAAAFYEPGIAWQREAMQDPRVAQLRSRVVVRESTDWASELHDGIREDDLTREFPVWLQSSITIRTPTGEYTGKIAGHTKGHPSNPVTRDEVKTKFEGNVGAVMDVSGTRAFLQSLLDIESAPDVSALFVR